MAWCYLNDSHKYRMGSTRKYRRKFRYKLQAQCKKASATHTHKVNFLTGRNWTEHRSYIMLENDSHGQCMGLGTGLGLWMAVESYWLNHGVV